MSFVFDHTSVRLLASAPRLPKHDTFCTQTRPSGRYFSVCCDTLSHTLATLAFAHIALATGSSASFSALPPKNNGYISTAIEANTKSYDLTKSKFVKGTGLARATYATTRTGSFGGYTVSPTKRLRPFILPTQVHQEVNEKDVFSYVGTTSNVPRHVLSHNPSILVDNHCMLNTLSTSGLYSCNNVNVSSH